MLTLRNSTFILVFNGIEIDTEVSVNRNNFFLKNKDYLLKFFLHDSDTSDQGEKN